MNFERPSDRLSRKAIGIIGIHAFIGWALCTASMVVLGNFDMFSSLLGTWIPFSLIFASTYVTGLYVLKSKRVKSVA